MEDRIVGCVRSWLKLNSFSTRSMFSPRAKGGLGIFNPSALYAARHLSFKLSVLNSDDPQVCETARASLELHMQRRKVPHAPPDARNSFCGYQTTEGATSISSRE